MDRQAASARRASASALTSMSACGEEGKSGNGDVQRDDGEKRRRNDEEDDVATVPAAAAVRPASTSSGTLPISAAVDSNYATTTNVESQKFRKSGERGEEDARRLGSSTSLGCAARRHGPITTTQHPDSPPPDYDDCVARAHRDGPLPQTCSSSVADQAMATAAASGVSTTSASTAKSTSTSSSRSKTKDDQPDKEKEYGSHDSNSKPSKDKGKRRADDFSNATGAQHKNDMLDDTKLSNPNLREATELAALPRPFSSSSSSMSSSATGSRVSQRRVYSGVDATAGGVGSLSQTRSGGSGSSSVRSNLTGPLWWQGVQRWWGRQVSVTVEVKGMRDHLALERTFLGYLRTSIALSMTGVILAQLFRLQHSLHPDEHLGFYVLGIPLASTFIACAIAVALLGAFRFWRQQSAIVRGKVLAGGWEVLVIMGGSLVLTTAVFILLVLVDVRREDKPTYKS